MKRIFGKMLERRTLEKRKIINIYSIERLYLKRKDLKEGRLLPLAQTIVEIFVRNRRRNLINKLHNLIFAEIYLKRMLRKRGVNRI